MQEILFVCRGYLSVQNRRAVRIRDDLDLAEDRRIVNRRLTRPIADPQSDNNACPHSHTVSKSVFRHARKVGEEGRSDGDLVAAVRWNRRSTSASDPLSDNECTR